MFSDHSTPTRDGAARLDGQNEWRSARFCVPLTSRLVGSWRSTAVMAGSPLLPNTRHSVRALRLPKRLSGCSRALPVLSYGTWTLRSSSRCKSDPASAQPDACEMRNSPI